MLARGYMQLRRQIKKKSAVVIVTKRPCIRLTTGPSPGAVLVELYKYSFPEKIKSLAVVNNRRASASSAAIETTPLLRTTSSLRDWLLSDRSVQEADFATSDSKVRI